MITKKDFDILRALDRGARQSNTKIARSVKLSKDVVNYRIKKLEDDQILMGYYALIDGFKIENNLFKLLLRFQNVGKEKEQKIINWLKTREEVIWIGSCDGQWNLIITFQTKNIVQLTKFIQACYSNFGKYFYVKELLVSYEARLFNEKYLPSNRIFEEYLLKKDENTLKLDKKDKIILFNLSKNARLPTIDIAKKVNLTAEAVAKRIKRLMSEKIILDFRPRINFEKLGFLYYHVFISLKDISKIKEIIEYYRKKNSCVSIFRYIGFYDMHVELVLDSNQKLREEMLELRDKFGKNIMDSHPLMIYKEHRFIPIPS